MTVVFLYFASIWPTGLVGLVALASMFTAAAVIETGLSGGLSVYIVSSALGMLLIPNKSAPLLYVLFLGYYPVLKSIIERRGPLLLQWALKLVVFNVSLTAVWFLAREVIFGFTQDPPGLIFIYIGGSVVFCMFDYGFSKVIWLYINRISKAAGRGSN